MTRRNDWQRIGPTTASVVGAYLLLSSASASATPNTPNASSGDATPARVEPITADGEPTYAQHSTDDVAAKDPRLDTEGSVAEEERPHPNARWIRHRVVPRETVRALAYRYGVAESKLREWNGLGPDHEPKRKQRLRIFTHRSPPPRKRIEHIVIEGDTWGSIARHYGVSYRDLRAYNIGKVGHSADPGEVLQIWIDPIIRDSIENDRPPAGAAGSVRPGAHSVGTPNEGALINGVQLPESPNYWLRYPKSAYGTTHAVRSTIQALEKFRARTTYTGKVKISGMSRPRGGELGHHKSHQSGRDLDVRLPTREGVPNGIQLRLRHVDWIATWELIRAFVDTGQVKVVFLSYSSQRRLHKAVAASGVDPELIRETLQWPVGKAASRGIVKHEPGHELHIHVRFVCGPSEPECAD